MGRQKIKHETKREKKDFCLWEMQEEGETWEQQQEVCRILKREQQQGLLQKRKERAAKMEPLREKEDNQERVVCGEENRKERAKCCRLWER